MSRYRSVFPVYLLIGLMMFGFAAQATAQGTRNERNVRDILRSLNSKIEITSAAVHAATDTSSISIGVGAAFLSPFVSIACACPLGVVPIKKSSPAYLTVAL